MILPTITVYIIKRDFRQAPYWSLARAVLSWVGLMHSYKWTIADTVVNLGRGTGSSWTVGYILAILFFYVSWQTRQKHE